MKKMNKVGDTYKGFTIIKYLPIDELKCTLVELTHEATGASVTHIANNDEENLFCLNFKTIPYSSNGIAHILEHTVLCGSKKYPVKDPFFSMTRRSLNTFMNAMTGSDFTCYPASSQIKADFYNLLEIYLDAVFHPLLTKESFLQEGYRLEFFSPTDPDSPLIFKGIVFNEMKGAMSSIDSRLWQSLLENLTPNLPYAFNSGGDPLNIIELTHQELLEFHKTYYHPSQCEFYFYGNFPLQDHLDFIEEKALKGVQKIPPLSLIKEQPRFSSPKSVVSFYPISDEEEAENKTIISFSWLTTKASNIQEVLILHLLDQILMGTDASLLKSKLLDSNYATQIDGYLDTEISEIPYAIVARGCREENIHFLENLLINTLKEIAEQPIPQDQIESAMHQLEFSRSEISSGSYPFGLILFFRTIIPKMYGASPESGLKIHSHFEEIRKKMTDPLYLSKKIQQYFIDNRHALRLVLKPSKTLLEEEQTKESALLKKIETTLSLTEKKALVDQSSHLLSFQKKQEEASLECLPKLSIEDIPHKLKDYPLIHEKLDALDIFFHNCVTNQIIYVDIVFDLPHIESEDLTYISLFQMLLTHLGCGQKTYQQTLDYIQKYTGGIDAIVSLNPQSENPNVCKPSFSLKGKALYRNTDKLFSILKDFLQMPHFNEPKRIKQLILELHTQFENSFTKNAMQYAITNSLSSLSSSSYVYDQWHGLPLFKLIRRLVQDIDANISMLMEKLQELKSKVLNLNQMHLIISCDQSHFDLIKKERFYDLNTLKTSKIQTWTGKYSFPTIDSHAYALPLPVAFTSMACSSVGFTHPNSPYLLIASHLMENLILHKQIREIGGAYGSGAVYSPTAGHFYFYSYRDPHIQNTKNAFEQAIIDISSGKFNKTDLNDAKLGVIQSLDAPIPPSSRAITAYIWKRTGKTPEMRQEFRDKVLSANKQDIIEGLNNCLLPYFKNNIFVTFSGKSLIDKELHSSFPIYQI